MYIVICLVSLFVSGLTLFSGFGLGTLLMPAFAIFFPIEIAIAATAIVHLANNVFKALLVGKMADMRTTLKFAIPASLAAILGAFLLVKLGNIEPLIRYELLGRNYQVEPIKFVIGLILVTFSATEVLPKFQKITLSPKLIPLGGLISGFFGGLSGVQGALRSMFLIRANLSKEQFIGTTVLSAVIVDISRLSVYGTMIFSEQMLTLKDGGVLGLVIAGSISAFIGSVIGAKFLKKITLKTVQVVVATLLFLVGIGLATGLL